MSPGHPLSFDARAWRVVEAFTKGKRGSLSAPSLPSATDSYRLHNHDVLNGDVLNEDIVVVTDRLVAVVDGVTDKTGMRYASYSTSLLGSSREETSREEASRERDMNKEVSSGRFAAEVVARALVLAACIDPHALIDPHELIESVSKALADAVAAAAPGLPRGLYPQAQFIAYLFDSDTLLGVGDCQAAWRTGETVEVLRPAKRVDELNAAVRAFTIAATGWDGTGPDPGRAVIAPVLNLQATFANTEGEWGFGVINGEHVPLAHRFVRRVTTDELVLATDGYPSVCIDGALELARAEANLERLLALDPRCVAELRGTKGLVAGNASFDDRAWVRIAR